jgi:hypothetical protein
MRELHSESLETIWDLKIANAHSETCREMTAALMEIQRVYGFRPISS